MRKTRIVQLARINSQWLRVLSTGDPVVPQFIFEPQLFRWDADSDKKIKLKDLSDRAKKLSMVNGMYKPNAYEIGGGVTVSSENGRAIRDYPVTFYSIDSDAFESALNESSRESRELHPSFF